ncbi:predicted protein, partial [Postia placenta Mad-698-R]
ALTAWPIAGHVHHLKVDPEQPFFPGLPYESSISLIQRVSPVRLSFTIGTRVGLSFWTNVVDSVPRLRILEVDLLETFYTPDLGVMHVEPWINSTILLLNPFSAVDFEIQINIAHSRPKFSPSVFAIEQSLHKHKRNPCRRYWRRIAESGRQRTAIPITLMPGSMSAYASALLPMIGPYHLMSSVPRYPAGNQ